MAVHFKLTKENGLTRRITFATRPTWPLLAARIATLYDVPVQNVVVSYIDSDNDQVMLSSDEELHDFYMSIPVSDKEAFRLAVHDLSSMRVPSTRPPPHTTAPHQHFRNTFGGYEPFLGGFEVEGDWQRLPGPHESLFLSRDAPESPHAFVEELGSDVSILRDREARSADASRSDLTFTLPVGRKNDKGKGRAATVEDDISSAGSVIGDEVPAKPPVHVYDMSDTEDVFGCSPFSSSPAGLPQNGAATPAQAHSTPVITEQTLKHAAPTSTEQRTPAANADDPPLPTLDSSDPAYPGPSLTHDVAAFLTTLSTVISTHPELSEGIRNIVANATNGIYWATHRDALSRAAENIQRMAVNETGRTLGELRRTAEEEAGARVAEALGRIFRAVGEFVPDRQAPPFTGNTPPVPPNEAASEPPRPAPKAPAPPGFAHLPLYPPYLPLHPPHIPPHPRRHHHSWLGQPPPFARPGGSFWGGFPHAPPPPPPPPPPASTGSWPRPPPPPFWGLSTEPESISNDRGARVPSQSQTHNNTKAGNFEDPILGTKAANVHSPLTTPQATAEQLRADVEKAKAEYKAYKERYRQAKATRKMSEHSGQEQESSTESPGVSRQPSDNHTRPAPDNNAGLSNSPTPIPVPEPKVTESTPVATPEFHIVSNARGPYPRLEMFSVPKRSHTMGHMHHMSRRHEHGTQENRSFNRITKKLADMGFTEGAYPNLAGKVMNQLLSHPTVTKDGEDDIVTNLIEELIPTNGAPPANGSGIPGGWH